MDVLCDAFRGRSPHGCAASPSAVAANVSGARSGVAQDFRSSRTITGWRRRPAGPGSERGGPRAAFVTCWAGRTSRPCSRSRVAHGGYLTALVEGIQLRERRRQALQAELAGLEGLPPVTIRDLQQIQQDVESRLADWRGLLGAMWRSAARFSRSLGGSNRLPAGENGTDEFSGQASLGRLSRGWGCTKTVVAPRGFELNRLTRASEVEEEVLTLPTPRQRIR